MFDDGNITEKKMRYLVGDQPKASRFYLLPNTHKAGNPGRPIVSTNGHFTVKLQESCPIPPETLLVSIDVTFLYTNITHKDGIRACKEAWEERPVKDPPTETLVKLLTLITLILKCNNFKFKTCIICRSKAQLWAQKLVQLMQIYSWDGWKDSFSDQSDLNYSHGSDSLMMWT